MLESVLDAGRYDMVFVESSDRAYSQIKKILPNLVILCTRIEELDGFQLLTMLKLDADTKDIPVLTYTTEFEGQEFDTALSQLADDDEVTWKDVEVEDRRVRQEGDLIHTGHRRDVRAAADVDEEAVRGEELVTDADRVLRFEASVPAHEAASLDAGEP